MHFYEKYINKINRIIRCDMSRLRILLSYVIFIYVCVRVYVYIYIILFYLFFFFSAD